MTHTKNLERLAGRMACHAVLRPASAACGGPLPAAWTGLARELPQMALGLGAAAQELPAVSVSLAAWESKIFNFYDFDAQIDDAAEREGPFAIAIAGDPQELPRVAGEVLTRCQRRSDRRNGASRGAFFDRVLAAHREAHDLAKPLVRADHAHALDVWQWSLRLAPDADLALQLAALLHDLERIESEADARREQHAVSYQGFKDAHAARSAEMAEALLAAAGADVATRERTARLIAAHERPPSPGAAEPLALALLNHADALSFFSLNSRGYLDYFGAPATRDKVAYTVRRMSPAGRRRLAGLRMPAEVVAALFAAPAEVGAA
jgi:Domain of unknown function (DUF4202)